MQIHANSTSLADSSLCLLCNTHITEKRFMVMLLIYMEEIKTLAKPRFLLKYGSNAELQETPSCRFHFFTNTWFIHSSPVCSISWSGICSVDAGTLGVTWKYSLDGTLIHHSSPCTCSFKPRAFYLCQSAGMFLGHERKARRENMQNSTQKVQELGNLELM